MENRWQEYYRNTLYEGKVPRSNAGKEEYGLLGNVGESVTVHFPDFNGANGFKPGHTDTYVVTLDNCNIPAGLISVQVLAANLRLWAERGYMIEY